MKIVLAPDKFKGSLSSIEAAEALERGVLRAAPYAEVIRVPMADGGEGTVEALVSATGGEWRTRLVTGPMGEKVEARYGVLGGGGTAVIEMAAASGLALVPPEVRDVSAATTYGTGELIRSAVLEDGCRKIILGLGGSATNDGGVGMAQALGVRFTDADGTEIGFGGGGLARIAAIDVSEAAALLDGVEIVAACDVTNPLYGPSGAAFVYGPQKGGSGDELERLDRGLQWLAAKVREQLGIDAAELPGAGAAGGLGYGAIVFLGAELRRGVELVADAARLPSLLAGASLVLTGEGRTDAQSASGKVPQGVACAARAAGVPAVCVSGGVEPGAEALYEHGMTALFSIADGPLPLDEAIARAPELLERAAENVVRLFMSRGGGAVRR
ncbi:glycerate kinase [Paenibacillus thermotolerans]|uniref:glycerate kinase n=1 Tax=Paenibacillus thermotolerans TaxID=3027807 RepID=UPI0023685708|nr:MULTISPECIES: glycerate kinase [unclassified Paenibacillus]